jgi:diguanylate cyclase (GGDEF)-like protein/PAS domain S-box-containing protein
VAVAYLRNAERRATSSAMTDYPLRDVFYSLTYRDKFEAERARRESEMRQIFARITDAYIAIDTHGVCTYANARAADIFGKPAEAIVGRHVDELVPREGEPLRAAIRNAMDTQQAVEVEEHYPSLDRWFQSRIFPSANGVTVYFQDVTERVVQRHELERLATIDDLTGLPNRAAMRARIDRMLAQANMGDDGVGGIALLNLDRLHQVNDTLGYAAGDAVLTQAAARLTAIALAHDCTLGRVGGDDFALICPGCGEDAMHRLATLATHALGEPFQFEGEPIYVTCSAGITLAAPGGDASRLLGESDLALNLAKQRGRNRVAAYSSEQARAIAHRVAITARMRDALAHGHFHFHLQPLVAAETGRINGAEALLRWTSPDMGVVSPADFISVAEETGFIVPLGDWVLHAVLDLQAQWVREFGGARQISVNVSAVQLRRPKFEDDILKALRKAGVPADMLKLEITESAIMEDTPTVVAMLRRLRDSGVRISLDDFGTGYSSLALLRHLPIDEIKIDRVFVAGAMEDAYAATLCRAIITMSRELRLAVVAEGVETAAQAAFLRDAGCDTLQGFFFSRAVPPADFRALLVRDAPLHSLA